MEEQDKQSQEEVKDAVEEVEQEVKQDRPEENYKAELARKNARIAELERERLSAVEQPVKRDQNDITTWSDAELKMLRNSPDANLATYREQADDLLLERKVKAMQAKEYEARRREEAQSKLMAEHPEAMDSSSEFGRKVEQVMKEYDLSRTPAGRLVAAKIVAAEGKVSKATGQNKETDRVSRVKANMVDGDRPKPTETKNPSDSKELKDKLMNTKNEQGQIDAVGQILKDRGINRDNFFKK